MKQVVAQFGFFILFFCFIGFSMITESCKHDPFLPEMVMPMDTMTIDTMPMDTMPIDTMGMPCDTEKIYFKTDVLPIFNSNCATAGCHDAQTGEAGIMLNSYDNIIATSKVKPFSLNDSDLYERITETDDEKRMPPPPRERLTPAQVQIIVKWILQGADNLQCDEIPDCDTIAVSYSTIVNPILVTHCVGCHGTTNPSGGVSLKTYEGVRSVAMNGRLAGAINHQAGYIAMPFNLDKLPNCEISQITSWINQGALNN